MLAMATTRKTGNLTDAISYRDDSAGASLRPCAFARVAVDNQYCLSHSGSTSACQEALSIPCFCQKFAIAYLRCTNRYSTHTLCLFFFPLLVFY